MKPMLVLTLIASLPQFSANAQASAADKDYSLGHTVGACLIAKCLVFTGWIATQSPISDQPVSVRVNEQLFGTVTGPGTVEVPYSAKIRTPNPESGPGYAWWHVTPAYNAPITVVLALERIGDVRAGQPVLVTSDERTSETIRSLAAEAARLEASPDTVSNLVASLSSSLNPALAGYLYVHLRDRESMKDPDLGESLLGQMIGNLGVPPATWNQIGDYMVLHYVLLSAGGRASAIRRFMELGQEQDFRAALAGFRGLSRIAKFDDSVKVPEGLLGKVKNGYRSAVEKRTMLRDPSLEMDLGIKQE